MSRLWWLTPAISHASGFASLLALYVLVTSCSAPGAPAPSGAQREYYGAPVELGEGRARTYVVVDQKRGGAPLELGIALDAAVVDGRLPDEMKSLALPLPKTAPAPYTFALFDWMPHGHVPPEIYSAPHFDFHFYLVPYDEVMAIQPDAPDYAANANSLPTDPDLIPPSYFAIVPPGAEPVSAAVPGMGLHWADRRTPELQGFLGHPERYEPFTRTFLYGSWAGRFTFLEPMITREYLQRRTDEVIEIPRPRRYAIPGWYPNAYRITYDPQAREYRVGLVGLRWYE